ncbi:NADH:flavin oxidoreductase [Oscillospiraceae bacterium MB08-C2-2]|nr:NADH:flavin oxidoreductase [Oscillospiraceae bacterium MB08-C2-2]
MSHLFQPLTLRNLTLRNRIAIPAMVVQHWSDDSGCVTEKNIAHYREMAKGGAGLIIQEATCISPDGRLADTQLGIWDDNQIPGLRQITEAVHEFNTPIIIQIHHAGIFGFADETLCPSDIVCTVREQEKRARALTEDELHQIQDAFVAAAERAVAAGYDGIELHACHSYLISQFYNTLVNKRTDAYGKQPSLFILEIFREIRRRVPEDFVIGVRLGAFEPTLEESIAHGAELAENSIDFLDISYGFEQRSQPTKPEDYPFSDRIYAAQKIKEKVSIPVFAVGEIASAQQAEEILEKTKVDMVDIGRGTLVNPHWANDAKAGRDVGTCLYCKICMWRVKAENCPGRKKFQHANGH